jgi:hypothetical protein
VGLIHFFTGENLAIAPRAAIDSPFWFDISATKRAGIGIVAVEPLAQSRADAVAVDDHFIFLHADLPFLIRGES